MSAGNVGKKTHNNYEDEGVAATPTGPGPLDFDEFLPWACAQLSVEVTVIVNRKFLNQTIHYGTPTPSVRSKKTKKHTSVHKASLSSLNKNFQARSVAQFFPELLEEDYVLIETFYDSNYNLVKIKFCNNNYVPRQILKILGMVVHFHPSLESISINSGLAKEVVYEIAKILPISNVTEVCLDYTYLREANYYLLLDQPCLKHLSVSKCRLNDDVVSLIAQKLSFSQPASKKLSALNLSTNHITDVGAKHIADMLRTNRQLSYLNLADNRITDEGAIQILNTLKGFTLDYKEIRSLKARYVDYLQTKTELVRKVAIDMKATEMVANKLASAAKRRKSIKMDKKNKTLSIAASATSSLNMQNNLDAAIYEKAENYVLETYGPFVDPYNSENTEHRNGVTYCLGNNTLQYLNVSYNNLSFVSAKLLLNVLLTQQQLNRKPKGLINVRIDGNFLPKICEELLQIDEILTLGLSHIKSLGGRAPESGSKKKVATAKISATH